MSDNYSPEGKWETRFGFVGGLSGCVVGFSLFKIAATALLASPLAPAAFPILAVAAGVLLALEPLRNERRATYSQILVLTFGGWAGSDLLLKINSFAGWLGLATAFGGSGALLLGLRTGKAIGRWLDNRSPS